MLLHVFGIVFHRLSFVHGVEIKLGVVTLHGLEVHPQCLLDTVQNQSVGSCGRSCDNEAYHRGSILTGFGFSLLIVCQYPTVEADGRAQVFLEDLEGGSKARTQCQVHVDYA